MLVKAGVRKLAIALVATAPTMFAAAAPAAAAPSGNSHVDCAESALCAEVGNRNEVFGDKYVGHDEPSAVFYSNKHGAGNRAQYTIRIPSDPSASHPTAPGKS